MSFLNKIKTFFGMNQVESNTSKKEQVVSESIVKPVEVEQIIEEVSIEEKPKKVRKTTSKTSTQEVEEPKKTTKRKPKA